MNLQLEKQLNSLLSVPNVRDSSLQLKCVGVGVHSFWSHQGEKKRHRRGRNRRQTKKNQEQIKLKKKSEEKRSRNKRGDALSL